MKVDLIKSEELSCLSKKIGQSEKFVQAGGGNTSVKLDERNMIIKASGCQLTDVTIENGFSVVDYSYLAMQFSEREVLDSEEQELLSASLVQGSRPSIETFLHAVTGTYTIHSHDLGVTAYTVRENGLQQLKEMFPNAVMVEYATPGIRLAKAYYSAIQGKSEKDVIFLKNHGLVVSADSMQKAIELHHEINHKICKFLSIDDTPALIGQILFDALQTVQKGCIAFLVETDAVKQAIQKSCGIWNYAYSPDCVVYCGGKIPSVNLDNLTDTLKSHVKKYGILKAVLVNGYLFAIAENIKKAKETACMLDFSAQVFLLSDNSEQLSKSEIDYLLNWDSEKYRASKA